MLAAVIYYYAHFRVHFYLNLRDVSIFTGSNLMEESYNGSLNGMSYVAEGEMNSYLGEVL